MRRILVFSLLLGGCAGLANDTSSDEATQPEALTGYYSPDGTEAEVTVEGDVAGSEFQGPEDSAVMVTQFAGTYLATHKQIYLESLGEVTDAATRIEWQNAQGAWVAFKELPPPVWDARLHYRIRGVNAVLLNGGRIANVGDMMTVPAPIDPMGVYAEAGGRCADPGGLGVSNDYYWMVWDPDLAACNATRQYMKVTLTKKAAQTPVRYPEYDRLLADHQITVAVLFGQMNEPLTDADPGYATMQRFATLLTNAGFQWNVGGLDGRPYYSAFLGGVLVKYDLYGPNEFSGPYSVRDGNAMQDAISNHEIIVYDGHTVFGDLGFWSKLTYPSFYQIFFDGGCMGYESAAWSFLAGKGGWGNFDLVTSVVEVTAKADRFAWPALQLIHRALLNNEHESWGDLLGAIRTAVGNSTFGVSGVSDNCYTPSGDRC